MNFYLSNKLLNIFHFPNNLRQHFNLKHLPKQQKYENLIVFTTFFITTIRTIIFYVVKVLNSQIHYYLLNLQYKNY